MKININGRMTIGELQEKFSALFPNLRLAFFRPKWNPSFLFLINEIRAAEQFEDYEKEIQTSDFNITPFDHIAEVKQKFYDRYNLEVCVMWQYDGTWRMTDPVLDYTLKQQNILAEKNSKHAS